MNTNLNRQREQPPVFVDASGRRQRRLHVAGAIVVLPAVGYVSLLLSTVLGGPTIHSPFLPLPAPPAAVAAQHPKPTPTSATTSGPAQHLAVDVASTQRSSDPAPPVPVALPIPVTPPILVGLPTSSLTTGPTKTSAWKPAPAPPSLPTQARGRPTALPTPVKTAKGKPASLPVPPRRPIKTPR